MTHSRFLIGTASLALLLTIGAGTTASSQTAPVSPEHDAILAVVDGFMTAISTNQSGRASAGTYSNVDAAR